MLVNTPKDYKSTLGALPSNTILNPKTDEPADLIQVFVTTKKELEEQLGKLKPRLAPKGLLWVTYPKGTSKVKTDLNRDSIAQYASTVGLQAVAIISVDETWSALRLKMV